jgi:hypothetical protein
VISEIQLASIRPDASESELIAITTAMLALWPRSQAARQLTRNDSWRFSRREWFGTLRTDLQ